MKVQIITLFIAFILLSGFYEKSGASLDSRDIKWIVKLSMPFSMDAGCVVKQTHDEGYIAVVVSAKIFTIHHTSCILQIIKLDEEGKREWEKSYTTRYFDENVDLCITNDERYVILARKDNEMFMVKMDTNGNEMWNKTYPINASIISFIQCEDNKFLFTAKVNDSYYMLIKTDENGNEIWRKNYTYRTMVAKLKDGYIIAESPTIYTRNYTILAKYNWDDELLWIKKLYGITDISGVGGTEDFFAFKPHSFFKFDKEGHLEWKKEVNDFSIFSCILCMDGGFLLAGASYIRGKGIASVLKLDEKGNEEWKKMYLLPRYSIGNGFLLYELFFTDSVETNDGFVMMAQRMASPNALFVKIPAFFIVLILASFWKTDVFLMKISP